MTVTDREHQAAPGAGVPGGDSRGRWVATRGRWTRPVAGVAMGLVLLAGAWFAGHATTSAPTSKQILIWLTGYSWQDNTPPGSSDISNSAIHRVAGGIGTYADPITVATYGDRWHLAVPAGTRFYLPTVSRYVVVEDSGASPRPPFADTHLDMWVGGQGGTDAQVTACEESITGQHVPAIEDPPSDLPVTPGPIFDHGHCNAPPVPAAAR
jgi:hypothetical protein